MSDDSLMIPVQELIFGDQVCFTKADDRPWTVRQVVRVVDGVLGDGYRVLADREGDEPGRFDVRPGMIRLARPRPAQAEAPVRTRSVLAKDLKKGMRIFHAEADCPAVVRLALHRAGIVRTVLSHEEPTVWSGTYDFDPDRSFVLDPDPGPNPDDQPESLGQPCYVYENGVFASFCPIHAMPWVRTTVFLAPGRFLAPDPAEGVVVKSVTGRTWTARQALDEFPRGDA
jgi:hypothetical protein